MLQIRDKLLQRIFLLILGVCLVGMLAANLYVYPLFTKVIIANTEKEAVTIARHISRMILPQGSELFITHLVNKKRRQIAKMADEFGLLKLKIFVAGGETVFSTDPKDLGIINQHDYFHNEVSHGKVVTKYVQKDTMSLEGQKFRMDVVETYIPIIQDEKFIGALEIYYNITKSRSIISRAVTLLNVLSFLIITVFLVIFLTAARRLDKNIIERKLANEFLKMTNIDLKNEIQRRKKTEKEKEKLIVELEESLLTVNTLKGLVPICSFCKNIRNDSGYWEKMEQYVEAHSDAEFSHGLCPDCAKEKYPDLHLDEDDETYAKRNKDGENPDKDDESIDPDKN